MKSPVWLFCAVLERTLFRAWCQWLCGLALATTGRSCLPERAFDRIAEQVDEGAASHTRPFFPGAIWHADLIFTPYIRSGWNERGALLTTRVFPQQRHASIAFVRGRWRSAPLIVEPEAIFIPMPRSAPTYGRAVIQARRGAAGLAANGSTKVLALGHCPTILRHPKLLG